MLTVDDLALPLWDEPAPAAPEQDPLVPPWVAPVPAAAAPRPSSARQVLRPAVWLLAVVYLVADRAGRALGSVLDAYVRGADAAGRAVRRACLAVLRWLGPLGRLLRRVSAPVVRLLSVCWDRLSVWVLLRMFRPLGRFATAVWARCRPPLERLVAQVQRLAAHVEPLLRALAAAADAVEAAAARLAGRWRRVWAPVVRRARELRRRR